MKMHGCDDNFVMVYNLVEELRGPALENYNSLSAEIRSQFSTFCTQFEGRFGRQEPPATMRSKMKNSIQRVNSKINHYPSLLSGPFEWQLMAIREWGRMDPGVGRGCFPYGMY